MVNPQKTSEFETKVLNNDNQFLDSKENEKMINNGEIFDLSQNPSAYSINNYIIESISDGCDFNLNSKISIIQKMKQEIILNFIDKDTSSNIQINCILSNDYKNKIPCSLEQEINKNFSLESYFGSNKQGFFYITQDNNVDSFHLKCQKKKNKGNISKSNILIIIITIISSLIVVITIILMLIFCFRKKKKNISKNENQIKASESQENIKDNNT